MNPKPPVYDPAFADGRFQLEILALRWALVLLYALFFATGVIRADARWFLASESFIVAYHAYYTWTVCTSGSAAHCLRACSTQRRSSTPSP